MRRKALEPRPTRGTPSIPRESVPRGASRTTVAFLALALVVVNLIAYGPVLGAGFVYDDELYVTRNAQVRDGLTLGGLRWAFTSFDGAIWDPLTRVSHMLDVSLFGLDPAGHHGTNLALHVVNTLLLFGLLLAMTGAARRSALVAALFAIHPLHVEAVAWVSSRKDLLSTIFWFATTGAYIAWVRRPGPWRYALVVAGFAAGLMAKPMVVTLPFALLLLDVWPLGRVAGRAGGTGRALVKVAIEKVPLFVLAVVSGALAVLGQSRGGALGFGAVLPPGVRIENAIVSYVSYLWQTIWPSRLAVHYPHPGGLLPVGVVAGALLLLLALSAAAVRTARVRPFLAVGWFWYLGTLVPVIGFVQFGSHARADRFTYVPLVGLFLAAVWGVSELLDRSRLGRARAIVAIALPLVLAGVSRGQAAYWKDDPTLFRHALAVTHGNAVAHEFVGIADAAEGRTAEAMAHFEEALLLRPDWALAENNLGNAFLTVGRRDEAIRHFERAIEVEPTYADAIENLGTALAAAGRLEEGLARLEEAMRLRPGFFKTCYNAGVVAGTMGSNDVAIGYFKEALRLDPSSAEARHNLEVLEGRSRTR